MRYSESGRQVQIVMYIVMMEEVLVPVSITLLRAIGNPFARCSTLCKVTSEGGVNIIV